jgi:PIN domain nuclease of toxin-antitoxin system
MDILLDSHALLWFLKGNTKMPEKTVEVIHSPENEIYVSIASVWEIAIKTSIGKVTLDCGIDNFIKNINDNGFSLLAISPEHIKKSMELPFIHRDPFDRLIIAQAVVEGMNIITADENIVKYDVSNIW